MASTTSNAVRFTRTPSFAWHALLLSGLASAAFAAEPVQPDTGANAASAFADRFRAQNPGTRVDAVAASPIAGLWEVAMGRNIAYVDASGRYALFGHVWDMQARRDLTADRLALLDRIDVHALPTHLPLRHVKGKGSRVLHVFADPQCGYCRQLEQTLAGLDDLTVYTWVLPILGAPSQRTATAVLCAADPAQAWRAWMLHGVEPAAAAPCSASANAAEVEQLAKRLGIAATPTLIAGDGRRRDGALDAASLLAWLDAPASGAGSIAMPNSTPIATPIATPIPTVTPAGAKR